MRHGYKNTKKEQEFRTLQDSQQFKNPATKLQLLTDCAHVNMQN